MREKGKIKKKVVNAHARVKTTGKNITKQVKHRMQNVNQKRKELILKLRTTKVKTADVFTLLNASFGLLTMFFALQEEFAWASIILLLAVACDVLDGRIARRQNNETELGKELDSLADIVSFGVAPVIFAFMMNSSTWAMVIYVVFLCCGIIRLARFNIQDTHIHFYGMPITTNGYLIPLLYLLKLPSLWWPIALVPLAILMVCRFKVRKIQ